MDSNFFRGDIMAANNSTTFILNANIGAVSNMINDPSFACNLHFTLKYQCPDGAGYKYGFRHGVSFSSWGEDVTIHLAPLSELQTQVFIRSECCAPTQVVDWGKNAQNTREASFYMQSNINRYQPQAPAEPQNQTVVPPVQPQGQTVPRNFCTNCGAAITTASNFCSNCGARLV